MIEELLDVINTEGKVTSQCSKSVVHEKGLWHKTVQIVIYNSKNEILIQKRSKNKHPYPGLWDIKVAGHCMAGESIEQAAIRELQEEVGLKLTPINLKIFKVNKKQGIRKKVQGKVWVNNEFQHIYLYKYTGSISDLKPIDKEVEELKFISIKKLEVDLNDTDKSKKYIPDRIEFYNYIVRVIEKGNKSKVEPGFN
jgi:isopentenyl-diphosphate delta-isomerase